MLNPLHIWLRTRLQPAYLRLLAGAIVLMGLALAIISYATAKEGTTSVGIPFGADFAGFFVAGQILDQHDVSLLYDRQLHAKLYHDLLPSLPKDEILPFVHPPFVAGLLRPFTWLPYNSAVVLWMIISLALYVSGVLLVLRTCPQLDQIHRWLTLLLCLSFEPFLFECWLGGQLSAVAFFSYALAWHCLHRRRDFAAGLALGLCFYKPTLLILIIPLLLLARLWKVLLGLCLMGLVLALLSILLVGWNGSWNYVNVLFAFRSATAGTEEIAIRTWKYVDFNHMFQLMIGNNIYKTITMAIVSLVTLGWLLIPRWPYWRMYPASRPVAWAATLFLLPLLNIYVGIYDSILIIPAVLIVTEQLLTHRKTSHPLHETGWPMTLLLLALAPWCTSYLARYGGVQVYSFVLLWCAVWAAKDSPTR